MVLHSIDVFARACATWFARLGGFLVVLIAVLVAGDVVARNLFNRTVFNAFEISIYLFAAAVSFGFAYTTLTGGNIRIDVVYARFPPGIRRLLDFLALLALTLLGAFFAFYAWRLTAANFGRGVMSNSALAVPLALPQAIWALGLTIFGLTAGLMTIRYALLVWWGDLAAADRLAGVGDQHEAREHVGEAVARETR